jgi:sarcosine oxidase gamma subunit
VQVRDHVLLPWATEIEAVDSAFSSILTSERIRSIIALIPDEWLITDTDPDASENRKVYEQFLLNRLSHSIIFVKEANDARKAFI